MAASEATLCQDVLILEGEVQDEFLHCINGSTTCHALERYFESVHQWNCMLLPPKEETLPPPTFLGYDILDRRVINLEIVECTKLLKIVKPNYKEARDIKEKLFTTYG